MDYSCSPSLLLKLCHVVTTHIIEIVPVSFSISKFPSQRHSVENRIEYFYLTNHGPFLAYITMTQKLARSDACAPGNQTFTGSIPGPAHSFVEIWS